MGQMERRMILIAVMGTSPAVLTETIWALAHQKKTIVPDEIVVITTKTGKARLWAELVEGGVWKTLVASLVRERISDADRLHLGETAIRVIPDASGNEIDDLRTAEDNLRAADFMLQEIRKYTESPDTIAVASIAGGRKTMSALLLSCMTLLGRAEDKVFHVLIPSEYEGGMSPLFYYPVRGVSHQILLRGQPTGKLVASTKVPIELFEVPFVRMRGWYQEKFKTVPPSYRALVARFQSVAPPARAYPSMEIDLQAGTLRLDGDFVRLSNTEFAALVLLSKGCGMRTLAKRLASLHKRGKVTYRDWLDSFREDSSRFDEERYKDKEGNMDEKELAADLNKTLSSLRKKLEAVEFPDVEALVPRHRKAVTFPLERIVWRNDADFAEVCGCPNIFTGESDVV